jgi:hydroxyacylglutathione hydrolase
LLRGASRSHVAAVDPGDAEPVLDYLDREGLKLAAILCTHHHGDHVGGIGDLARRLPVPVYGPASEHIPHRTHALAGGDSITVPALDLSFEVIDVPGHTLGHIAYYGNGILFCGDTLFSAGCGRLFEGTATQMHASLSRLKSLPGETRVYCAHEYTASNLRFAAVVEPGNPAIMRYARDVAERRARGLPTIPSTLALELSINPFLRDGEGTVREAAAMHAGKPLVGPVEIFAELRRWKDGFRG